MAYTQQGVHNPLQAYFKRSKTANKTFKGISIVRVQYQYWCLCLLYFIVRSYIKWNIYPRVQLQGLAGPTPGWGPQLATNYLCKLNGNIPFTVTWWSGSWREGCVLAEVKQFDFLTVNVLVWGYPMSSVLVKCLIDYCLQAAIAFVW